MESLEEDQVRLQVRLNKSREMQIMHKEKLDSGLAVLKIVVGMAEASKKRAVQGDVLVQETEEDLARIQARILETGKDTVALERQESAVQLQLGLMAKGGGLSLWPKPTLHPLCPRDDDFLPQIQLRPCGYCKQWFHCFDVVVTSCKHTFHPFCLAESLRSSNNCVTCGQILHPDWWTSFGFRAQDDDMQGHARSLELEEVHKVMIQAIREPSVAQNRPSKSSILMNSFFPTFGLKLFLFCLRLLHSCIQESYM
jgi:hypothetical protein